MYEKRTTRHIADEALTAQAPELRLEEALRLTLEIRKLQTKRQPLLESLRYKSA